MVDFTTATAAEIVAAIREKRITAVSAARAAEAVLHSVNLQP